MINFKTVTVQDCIENYEMKDKVAIINDGHVIDFIKENPHTDR